MTVYDWTKVRRETLEDLAHAVESYELPVAFSDLHGAMDNVRLQALVPPLRTRAEVDADIANEVRRLPLPTFQSGLNELTIKGIVAERLNALRAELLAPEPQLKNPEADPQHAKDAERLEPDRCSCEEALGLRERLGKIRALVRPIKRSGMADDNALDQIYALATLP